MKNIENSFHPVPLLDQNMKLGSRLQNGLQYGIWAQKLAKNRKKRPSYSPFLKKKMFRKMNQILFLSDLKWKLGKLGKLMDFIMELFGQI